MHILSHIFSEIGTGLFYGCIKIAAKLSVPGVVFQNLKAFFCFSQRWRMIEQQCVFAADIHDVNCCNGAFVIKHQSRGFAVRKRLAVQLQPVMIVAVLCYKPVDKIESMFKAFSGLNIVRMRG